MNASVSCSARSRESPGFWRTCQAQGRRERLAGEHLLVANDPVAAQLAEPHERAPAIAVVANAGQEPVVLEPIDALTHDRLSALEVLRACSNRQRARLRQVQEHGA